MAAVDRDGAGVPVLEAPSADDWRQFRRTRNGPCLLRGLFDPAPLRRWSPGGLAALAGERPIPVEYSVRRMTRLDPRVNAGRHLRRSLPFAAALEALEAPPTRGVTHYISALDLTRWLPELQLDVPLPSILGDDRLLGTYFFAGGDGTGSALHYDPTDNYILVTQGAKEVLMLPPGRLAELRVTPVWLPFCGVSRLGPEETLAYARGRDDARHCEVRPFDVLYLPRNWWHVVRNHGLTIGISMSLQWPAWSWLRWPQGRLCLRLAFERWLAQYPSFEARVDGWVEHAGARDARRPPRVIARSNPTPPREPRGSALR